MKNSSYNNWFLKRKKAFQVRTKMHLIILLIFTLISCEDYLEVDLPSSQLIGETVYQDAATAEAVLANVYSDIRETGMLTGNTLGISLLIGLYADELDYYRTGQLAGQFYQNSLLPSNNALELFWGQGYNSIYVANAVIEGLQNSTEIPKMKKDQLKGEALFVRGLMHFYLVNLFGEIPYVTTTNYNINTTVQRMPVVKVYQQIKEDLLTAKSLLSDEYFTGERVRPNKWVVSALLSRVYLYMEDWQKAEMESSEIINSPLFELEGNLADVFLKNSSSTVWQLHTGEEIITAEARTFIFESGPPPLSALTEDMMNSFETGDLRKVHWTGSVSNGTETWFFPYKYKQNSNTGTVTEYSIIFRLAEIFLIRAEARARIGDLEGALEDINKIRERAGLEGINVATQNELIDAILHERRMELFTEFGHRFFDLKRTGRADAVLSTTKPGWDKTDILLPIPESELLLNPNLLPQNPGY